MKRLFVLFLVLAFSASVFAFGQGTKTVGGFIGYSSSKANSDADPLSTIIINPMGGYFFIDNLCADLEIEYLSMNADYLDDPITEFGLGLGGRYFYMDFYGGAAFMMSSWNDGDYKYSANYLKFRLGYLVKIAENIYVDLGAHYKMGLGAYGGDMDEFDNEESEINIGGGVDIFFP